MELSAVMTNRFPHHHLLDIPSLSVADIIVILDRAEFYAEQARGGCKKFDALSGKTIINFFFETSTRTRTSFEIAAKRLGADVVNFSTANSSMGVKGETLMDTVLNFDAMGADALVVRHAENNLPLTLAKAMKASVINAGDGTNQHPTQALLDAFVIRQNKKTLSGLTLAYCGDYIRSRVANSFIELMHKFGNTIRVAAPPEFLSDKHRALGVEVFNDMNKAVKDADVIMTQRIQKERMSHGDLSMSPEDYHRVYGLDHEKLKHAKPDVIVLNPGPVVRDVEITSTLADDMQYSRIRDQVAAGVVVRMAVLDLLLAYHKQV
jgi:aspartate carbamoyltransferase catalytic subunit